MRYSSSLYVVYSLLVLHGRCSYGLIPTAPVHLQHQRMQRPQNHRLSLNQEPGAKTSDEAKKSLILDPFLEAASPNYINQGPVGEGEFVVSRTGGPRKEELSNENMLRIVRMECNDLEVNTLVWKCLGYRFDPEKEEWNNEQVFPKWREKFPTPPDLIGMQRIYSKEIDGPSLRSNQQLVRSIPAESKQQLRKHLRPLGFLGFKLAELIPNKTRRAQCANWLIFFREELFGYTVEELKERRRLKQEKEEEERLRKEREGQDEKDEFKPPVSEVF